jgi:hypothetical protein
MDRGIWVNLSMELPNRASNVLSRAGNIWSQFRADSLPVEGCARDGTGQYPIGVCSIGGASFVEARIRSHVAKPSCSQRSAQRLLHDRGPHYARHSFGHLLPLRIFDHEFFATIFCEPVILGLTIANRPRVPLENHPAPLLHPMSRRIE